MTHTGSTNADALDLARGGAPEGIVVVADHQTAGRGRGGRTWEAPPGTGLLVSILLRPPSDVADLSTMALAVAAAEAVGDVAGFMPRLKWPNDLVWPGDGSAIDRKLAGILAEAEWPIESVAAGAQPPPRDHQVVVVLGIGLNVRWPDPLPEDLEDIAIACNHITHRQVDREDLLVALLERFAPRYAALIGGDREGILAAWGDRSATLGRRVRVSVGSGDTEGIAIGVTDRGHLIVEARGGHRRIFAMGEVVHLRSA